MKKAPSNYTALRTAVKYARRKYRIEGRNYDTTGQYLAAVVAYYTALDDNGLIENGFLLY